MERAAPNRIALTLPERPVMSDLDPDAFGIICRNLLENALRHGALLSPGQRVHLSCPPEAVAALRS